MNRSGWADWAPVDYVLRAYFVVYNTDFGPYFGSVLGLGPEPTAEWEFAGHGVYVLYLGWASGDYWLTVLVSLWWLVVASLIFPFVRAVRLRVGCFSLRFLLLGLTIASVCFAFPRVVFAIFLNPLALSLVMAVVLGVRLAYDFAPRIARALHR